MTTKQALRKHLADTAAIKTLVAARVFCLVMDENAATPAITIESQAAEQLVTFGGSSADTAPGFKITAWAGSEDDANDLADLVDTALRDYAGALGGASSGVTAVRVFYDSRDEAEYDPDLGIFGVTATIRIAL